MPKSQISFNLSDIITGVEKALQPKFDSLEKKIDDSFHQLAAMTNKQFLIIQKDIRDIRAGSLR